MSMEHLMKMDREQLGILKIAKPKGKHLFDGFICEEYDEMIVDEYGRIIGDKKFVVIVQME